jgi:chromosome condensin MukBEF MukE localization factor
MGYFDCETTSKVSSSAFLASFSRKLNASLYERVYSKQFVRNPAGLFYRILKNENRKAA